MAITLDTLRSIKMPIYILPGEWKLSPRRYASLYDLISAFGLSPSSGTSLYTEVLPDVTTHSIPASTHNLTRITSVLVLDPSGNEVSVSYSIDNSQNLTLYSNVSLLNHTIILKWAVVYYEQVLGNVTTITIPYTTHGIPYIGSVVVLDPSGNHVDVPINLTGTDVSLNSNISLLNHKIILS